MRLAYIQDIVDKEIEKLQQPQLRKMAYVHSYGVAQAAAMLAMQRKADVELACIAALLHDISQYTQNVPHSTHAQASARYADNLLRNSGYFTAEEIQQIVHAIAVHSDKHTQIDGALAEILKDADVLQKYLYDPSLPPTAHVRFRLYDLIHIWNH